MKVVAAVNWIHSPSLPVEAAWQSMGGYFSDPDSGRDTAAIRPF